MVSWILFKFARGRQSIGNGNSSDKFSTYAGAILIGSGVLFAAPFATLSALSLAGFGATGPVAGYKL